MDLLVEWLSIGLVHGTALALLTGLAALTLLRRARPALLSALWLVVLLKFLVPIGPGVDLSLSSALERALGGAGAPPAVALPDDMATAAAGAPGTTGPGLAVLLLLGAYLGGVGWIAARRLTRRRALLRAVAALPVADDRTAAQVAAAARRFRLARLPSLRVDADAAGPYLVGRLRPVLVLPGWLDAAAPAWSAAVAHELAHLRRRDPLLGALEGAVTLLFWFWPPVTWVCRRLDRAREMACDQWALAHGPLGARDYARFLVAVATRRAADQPAALPHLALLRTRAQLTERVEHLLGGVRPASLGRRRAAVVGLWSLLCLAGASRSAPAAPVGGLMCDIDPALIAQILASHPDADADRDGVLSPDEACAHQLRMKQRLVVQAVDAELVSQLDPAVDLDDDGVFSADEIDALDSLDSVCSSERCKE